MRIDDTGAVNKAARIRPKHLFPVEETAGSGHDSLEVSSRAADIRTAMEALRSAPEVREERVAELSRQLEQGSLSLDPHALAEKLLRKP